MNRVRFGPDTAQPFSFFDSRAQVASVAALQGQLFVQGLHIPPGGTIGPHKGRLHYILLVTHGNGWVRTGEGHREPVSAGEALSWSVEENTELGSDDGLSGVWIKYALGGFWGPKRSFTAGGREWTVYLEAGNEFEHLACDQLERLLNTYDLTRWTFTTTIRICDFAIPHSHPVLTLNTRHLNDDAQQLSTFLHEQIHWYEASHQAQVAAAMAQFRTIFPDAPAAPPDGASELDSTYLHLIVCPLEYLALVELTGQASAREILRQKTYYTWVYERTLTDWERVDQVLRRHNLAI